MLALRDWIKRSLGQGRGPISASRASGADVATARRPSAPQVASGAAVPSSPPRATRCAACGASEARPLYEVQGFRIVACSTCWLPRTQLPPDFDPASIYDASYFAGGQTGGYADYQGSSETLRAEFGRTLAALERSGTAPGGSLIELGCAYGFFLDLARDQFSVSGVEVSAHAREACRVRGLRVEPELTQDFVAERGPFDVAVMLDVIEHLSDPADTLSKLRGALRPGAHLLITTGDVDALTARLTGRHWRLMKPPEHLWYFSGRTITALLARTGYRVLSIEHPWKVVPLSLIAFQALQLGGRSVPDWVKKLPGGIPLNLFDAMRVVAEAV
jgi:SAM-dependent methyltransferase